MNTEGVKCYVKVCKGKEGKKTGIACSLKVREMSSNPGAHLSHKLWVFGAYLPFVSPGQLLSKLGEKLQTPGCALQCVDVLFLSLV